MSVLSLIRPIFAAHKEAIIATSILLVLAWMGYGLYRSAFPATVTIHQRLSLSVSTPQGMKSGSAVTAVSARPAGNIVLDTGSSWQKGEATVVDLGGGRYLFALLGAPGRLASRLWREDESMLEMFRRLRRNPPPVTEVPVDKMPRLVTFGDINDPTSVQRVDPADLAASFGPGVRLKSMTLEITDAPVSTGRVEGVLGWIYEAGKTRFNVAKTPDGNIPLNSFLSLDHWGK